MMNQKKPSLGIINVEKGKEILQQLGFTLEKESWDPEPDPVDFYSGQEIKSGWGKQILIAVNDMYRAKYLYFDVGSKTSLHFHIKKHETLYILSGEYYAVSVDKVTGKKSEHVLRKGDILISEPYSAHQIRCVMKGEILELSNNDYLDDVVRIEPGDSQRKIGKK